MKNDVEKTIRDMLGEVKEGLDYSNMSLDREFEEAGLDSLDVASLLLSIQEHYDLNIEDDEVDNPNTLGKLVNHIVVAKAQG